MSRELLQRAATLSTVYSLLFLQDNSVDHGKAWNDVTKLFQIPSQAAGTDFALVHAEDTGSGIFVRDLPAELNLDRNYESFGYLQVAGSVDLAGDTDLHRQLLAPPQSLAAAFKVDNSRTWFVRAGTAGYVGDAVLPAQPTMSATFAADFSRVLNPATGIFSVSSVTEQGPSTLTIANLQVSQDRNAAYFRLSAMTDATTPRLQVTIITTDTQVLTADCILVVKDTP